MQCGSHHEDVVERMPCGCLGTGIKDHPSLGAGATLLQTACIGR